MDEKDELTRQAESGDVRAQLELGHEYYFDKDYMQAEYWYKKAAEGGDLYAQKSLAGLYAYHLKDYSKSLLWWRKAAEKGDRQAQYELGRMYEFGEGVPRNHENAVSWWKLSAEQGHELAEYCIGCECKSLYLMTGDAKAKEQGLYWLQRAYEHGCKKAQPVYIALLYH